jgi:hypothetical protein
VTVGTTFPLGIWPRVKLFGGGGGGGGGSPFDVFDLGYWDPADAVLSGSEIVSIPNSNAVGDLVGVAGSGTRPTIASNKFGASVDKPASETVDNGASFTLPSDIRDTVYAGDYTIMMELITTDVTENFQRYIRIENSSSGDRIVIMHATGSNIEARYLDDGGAQGSLTGMGNLADDRVDTAFIRKDGANVIAKHWNVGSNGQASDSDAGTGTTTHIAQMMWGVKGFMGRSGIASRALTDLEIAAVNDAWGNPGTIPA